ncbi:MAG: histidine--tRNA ligase family protein [Ktedonobacteraceae bacterium]|nr:histidine--tRNA ligase family protein [Ktedonobacteraceae bacterium]
MKKRIERLRGMRDLLPEAQLHQRWLIERLEQMLSLAGYTPVDTPILEQSDLFHASFGQELWQNLYAFRLHHRELCLRPEYTASICRLYLDHYQQQPLPVRFQYAGPIFRYETPGRERYRQHTDFGIELFGGQPLAADCEILQLACNVLHELNIHRYRLELGHVGVVGGFIRRLQLDSQAVSLLLSLMEQISRSEEGERIAQQRLEALYPPERVSGANGSSVESHYITSLLGGISISFGDEDARREVVERFLWKVGRSEQRRQILHALEFLKELHAAAGSPPTVFEVLRELLDRYELDHEPLAELQQFVTTIEASGVPSEQIVLNLALGRGVSYYTGLVFEIHARDAAGYDKQLCGGGRYDQLVRAVGGSRDLNACGFAFGIERLLSLVPDSELPAPATTRALVIPVSLADLPYALNVAREARGLGVRTEVDVTGHGVSVGLRHASRQQVPLALIVGEDERQQGQVKLHNMRNGEERTTAVADLLSEGAVGDVGGKAARGSNNSKEQVL